LHLAADQPDSSGRVVNEKCPIRDWETEKRKDAKFYEHIFDGIKSCSQDDKIVFYKSKQKIKQDKQAAQEQRGRANNSPLRRMIDQTSQNKA
jgi:hypothetical protein